jgi:hypothetical protein
MGITYANGSSTTTPLYSGAVLSGANVDTPKLTWSWGANSGMSGIYGTSFLGRSPVSDGEVWGDLIATANPAYQEPVGADGKPIVGALNEASAYWTTATS